MKSVSKIIPTRNKEIKIDFEKIAKKYFGAFPDLTKPKRDFRKRKTVSENIFQTG